jgi:hypothetical protein
MSPAIDEHNVASANDALRKFEEVRSQVPDFDRQAVLMGL